MCYIYLLSVKVKVSYPHHEVHKHHVTKIPDLKIETVPIEKEIKVLVPYKVPYEVKVPYIVHQKVHTHVESKPIHTSHHIHHPPKKTHHHGHHEHSHHHHDAFLSSAIPVSEHSFEDGKYFLTSNGYAASDVSPLYISHHPVEHPQSSSHSPHSSTTTFYDESGQIPQHLQQQRMAKIIRADLNDFTSTLHTSAFSPEIGFGSHEGHQQQHQQPQNDEEFDNSEERGEIGRYYEEFGPVLFKRKTKKVPATTATTTTPKPPQKKNERSKKNHKSYIHSEHPVGVGIPYKLRSFVRADEYEYEE